MHCSVPGSGRAWYMRQTEVCAIQWETAGMGMGGIWYAFLPVISACGISWRGRERAKLMVTRGASALLRRCASACAWASSLSGDRAWSFHQAAQAGTQRGVIMVSSWRRRARVLHAARHAHLCRSFLAAPVFAALPRSIGSHYENGVGGMSRRQQKPQGSGRRQKWRHGLWTSRDVGMKGMYR